MLPEVLRAAPGGTEAANATQGGLQTHDMRIQRQEATVRAALANTTTYPVR
ncbi:hypothetical protein D3C83_165390 [compost metagenome]